MKFSFRALWVLSLLAAWSVHAQEEPDRSGVGQYEFRLSELTIQNEFLLPEDLPTQAASRAMKDMSDLKLPARAGRVDVRSGRWATLTLAEPMLPGRGSGNQLGWAMLGREAPQTDRELGEAASQTFREFIHTAGREFRIDSTELKSPGKVTVHDNGSLIQIYIPRVFNGIPVRDSYITATINHGNLALFGANQWGDIQSSTVPGIPAAAALDAVRSFVSAFPVSGTWGATELVFIPMARGQKLKSMPIGQGYDYRLAWVVRPAFDGDLRRYEALVDADTGQILSFEDTNQYVSTRRDVTAGVYPVSNDGLAPDGVEQTGWPMPFDRVSVPGGTVITDSGGNLPTYIDGNITSNLSGTFVRINDACGAISLTFSGDLDFGSSGGTDCVTPGFGGPGNTHAARTGFYELNRIMEMGRGQLPDNLWLQQQLTSNMNIDKNCNAVWDGLSVNFYTSGGGCANTGEIAGIFDHEWGHGLDSNDAIPGISNPSGEGIADIYAALRLNTSCIGRNFKTVNCGGFGDACLSCTGVRDIDYLMRSSGLPHTFTWSNDNCQTSVHCIGAVYAEAVWSLWKRKLQAAPYELDEQTAHEIVTRLTFLGAGNTGTWFSGSPPNGGCAADSGYMNYLMADDDNGNLNDGTPHMTAIYNAFNEQEIACDTPVVQDSGCADAPTGIPVLVGSGLDRSVNLGWSEVQDASAYEVFRTDGVHGCDFGKVKVGETTGTTFFDTGLQNGRDYSYIVIPKGSVAACFGSASSCLTIAPVEGPFFDADPDSKSVSLLTGDADSFVDNCEEATLTFTVNSNGTGGLTNVRITGVKSVSHPGTIVTSTFPSALSPSSFAQGQTSNGSFNFTAARLPFGADLVFEVALTSDELFPLIRSFTLSIGNTETDLLAKASKTWGFETGLAGWTLVNGTFNQATLGGGSNGSTGYMASSSDLPYRCDQIRSPLIQLTATSTLSLWSNYDIEGFGDGQWWDRANIAVFEAGERQAVDPDSGRLYEASGAGASCVIKGQSGWAGTNDTWAKSSWSAAALDAVNRAGQPIQLDVAYGTDPVLNPRGFWFDNVTVTDVELIVADVQSNACAGDNSDFDGDGLTNIEEFNIDPLLNPNNPDTDDDGIGDALDAYPLLPSNFCSGDNPQLDNPLISDFRQCAASGSVTIKGTTSILSTGSLEVISPVISIGNGFGVEGQFKVNSVDPCPSCP